MDTKERDELKNPSHEDYIDKFANLSSAELSATKDTESGAKSGINADSLKSKEETTPSSQQGLYRPTKNKSSKTKFATGLKKKGPIAAIVGLLVGGGIGMSIMLSPSMLIIHLKEVFVKSLNDADPALALRTNKMLWHKVNSIANGFEESSSGTCNIKCKFGTVSESMKLNLEKSGTKFGVEFNETKVAGIKRYTIKSFSYEGKTVTNATDFNKLMADPIVASDFKAHFNSRTAYLLNGKFSSMLRTKFGLDKLSKLKGETLEKVRASMRSALGLEGDAAPTKPLTTAEKEAALRAHPKYGKFFTGVEIASRRVSSVTNPLTMVCTSYNVGKATTWGIKAAKIAAYTTFAMLFLNMADKIKSDAGPTPAEVEQLGNMLTTTDSNGKSATDSAGYKMAAYQEPATLDSGDEKYGLAPVSIVSQIISVLVTGMLAIAAGSFTTAHNACKYGNRALLAAACSTEIAGAVIAAVATMGTTALIDAVAAAGICAAKLIIAMVLFSRVVNAILGNVISAVVQNELPILDENTHGTAAGNAVYSGSAAIMGGASASYGLKAGTKKEIQQYALDATTIKNQNDAIARYEAQKTPFDISNSYSFLGSFIDKLGVLNLTSSSIFSNLSSVLSIVPKSIVALTPSSFAAIESATSKADLYGRCTDWSLAQIGVDADILCNPSYVMSNEEMNGTASDQTNDTQIDRVIDYMIKGGYIDKQTGEPVADSDYGKYVTYCADRVDPLGETTGAVEDDDYEWEIGVKCVSKGQTDNPEMYSNFRVYTMDYNINQTMDNYAY